MALSKKTQLDLASRVGLKLLPTYFILGPEDLDAVPDQDFPLCIRPAKPGSVKPGLKAKVFDSRQDLSRFLQGLELQEPLIAQPFKNLPNLVLHGARTDTGQDFAQQGFLVPRKFGGVTLTMRHMPFSAELAEKCSQMVGLLGLTGSYHFEFLWDQEQEQTWFLELNARMGGTTAKALACGYDEPLFALQSYGVPQYPDHEQGWTQNTYNSSVSSKIALSKYLLQNLRSGLDVLDYPPASRLSNTMFALGAMLGCRDEVFSWRDLPGSLALWKSSLKGNH